MLPRRLAAHVAIDDCGVGPVGLDGDHGKAAAQDELLRDPRAHPVELRGAVRGLAEQDDLRVADPFEQAVERCILDARDRLGAFCDEPGDEAGPCRRLPRTQRSAQARRPHAAAGRRIGVGPALLADQRHELDRAEFLALERILGGARHADQLLRAARADGNHEPPADRELLEQRLRQFRAAGGDDDRVEGRMFRPAERAVVAADVYVRDAECCEALARQVGEFGMTLDRVDVPRDPREDRRRVARARADLEDGLAAGEAKRLGHHRNDVGLRDRLAGLDRQRTVVVREVGQLGRQECLAGNVAHRLQHARVAHAAGANLTLDHAFAFVFHRCASWRLTTAPKVVGHTIARSSLASVPQAPRPRRSWRPPPRSCAGLRSRGSSEKVAGSSRNRACASN